VGQDITLLFHFIDILGTFFKTVKFSINATSRTLAFVILRESLSNTSKKSLSLGKSPMPFIAYTVIYRKSISLSIKGWAVPGKIRI